MEIYINENKADITLDTEKILNDVLTGIENEITNSGAKIISINVDGENLNSKNFDDFAQKNIDEVNELRISSVYREEINLSFKNIKAAIEGIEENLSNISINLQTGKDSQVNKTIVDFADIFAAFCQTVTIFSAFPDEFNATKIEDKSILDFLTEFSPLLNDFMDAFEQKDTVMLGDLSEYEILPRLSQIKEFCSKF